MSYTPPKIDDIHFEFEESETTSTDNLEFDFTQGIAEAANAGTIEVVSSTTTSTIESPDDALFVTDEWDVWEQSADESVFVEEDALTTSEGIDGTDIEHETTTGNFSGDFHHWRVEMVDDYSGTIVLYAYNQDSGWNDDGAIEVYDSSEALIHETSISSGDTSAELDVDLQEGEEYYIGHTSGYYRHNSEPSYTNAVGDCFDLTGTNSSYSEMGSNHGTRGYGFYRLDTVQEPSSEDGEWTSDLWNPEGDGLYELSKFQVSARQDADNDIIDVRLQGYDETGEPLEGEDTGYVPVSSVSDVDDIAGSQFGVDFTFHESDSASYIDSYSITVDDWGEVGSAVASLTTTTVDQPPTSSTGTTSLTSEPIHSTHSPSNPHSSSSSTISSTTVGATSAIIDPVISRGISASTSRVTGTTKSTISTGTRIAESLLIQTQVGSETSIPSTIYSGYPDGSDSRFFVNDLFNEDNTLLKFDDGWETKWEVDLNIDDGDYVVDGNSNIYIAAEGIIASYDSDGNQRWEVDATPSNYEDVNTIEVTEDGYLYHLDSGNYLHKFDTKTGDVVFEDLDVPGRFKSDDGLMNVFPSGYIVVAISGNDDERGHISVLDGDGDELADYGSVADDGVEIHGLFVEDNEYFTLIYSVSDDPYDNFEEDIYRYRLIDGVSGYSINTSEGEEILHEDYGYETGCRNSVVDDEGNLYFESDGRSYLLKFNWEDGVQWEINTDGYTDGIDVTPQGIFYTSEYVDEYGENVIRGYDTDTANLIFENEVYDGITPVVYPNYNSNPSMWEPERRARVGASTTTSSSETQDVNALIVGSSTSLPTESTSKLLEAQLLLKTNASGVRVDSMPGTTVPDLHSKGGGSGMDTEGVVEIYSVSGESVAGGVGYLTDSDGFVGDISPNVISKPSPDTTKSVVDLLEFSSTTTAEIGGAKVVEHTTLPPGYGAAISQPRASIVGSESGFIDPEVFSTVDVVSEIATADGLPGIVEILDRTIFAGRVAIVGDPTISTATREAYPTAEVHGTSGTTTEGTVFASSSSIATDTESATTPTIPTGIRSVFGDVDDLESGGLPLFPELTAIADLVGSTSPISSTHSTPSVSTQSNISGVRSTADAIPLVGDTDSGIGATAIPYDATATPGVVLEPARPVRRFGNSTNLVTTIGGSTDATISGGNDLDLSEWRDSDS